MSVLIKGMKMPTSCGDCRFCGGIADTDCSPCAWCDIDGKARVADTRQECPLVEVPTPHGRLIDAEKLFKKGISLDWSLQKWVSEVDIGLMPTIIEAEEGEPDVNTD